MGHPQGFEPGEPVWIDLETPSGTVAVATQTFYCRLFGWRVMARHRPLDDTSGYWIFVQGESAIGGVSPGPKPVWSMYIDTTDILATAHSVVANGGSVLIRPTPVWTSGVMSVCADPFGARFSLWQPNEDGGAELMHEPNSFTWGELTSPDPDGAARFYNAVFGWEAKTNGTHTDFVVPSAGRSVTSMVATGPTVPTTWTLLFAVADAAAIAQRTVELGGSVVSGPQPHPTLGCTATLTDPSGVRFAVAQS